MMQPLFSERGLARLSEAVADRLLCAFDFDGTLAPIVPVPDQAILPGEIRERLVRLASRAPLAVITGRSLEDIRGRLAPGSGLEPDFIVGNHGMEGVPGMESDAARHERQCAEWHVQLARALAAAGNGIDDGVQVEDKRYSLSVHYRHAQNPDVAARALQPLFAALTPPPRVVAGKCVYNLVPQDAAHKGTALERLMQASDARHALYVGDDVTDEDVFRLRRHDVLSVRIGPGDDSAADFFLKRQSDIVLLLDELASRLEAASALNWMRATLPNR